MRITNAIKKIEIKDFAAPFIFILLLIPSFVFRAINKIRGRKLWLVAEEGEARDNGYHFYKYIRENHPKDYCFYAIKNSSAGYEKVNKLGHIIKWGSLKHWLFYMSANLNISSQKSGNPCPIFWYVVHVVLGLYRNRVFLQHGITKDDSKWIYYDKTKFKYFVCGAKREYEYILDKFGYSRKSLLLTGFPRWDNLVDRSNDAKHKAILIMPTWRNWLDENFNGLFKVEDFEETNFYKEWNGLLSDAEFVKYIEKNNIIVYFYPHIHMTRYLKSFKPKSRNIKMVSISEDIQEYFSKCSMMITDYSSVAFDFAYLRKPVIYYQFDYGRYRKEQLQEGYYEYAKDGFGPVVNDEKAVLDAMKNINKLRDDYRNRMDLFFYESASKCSEKLYMILRGMA